MITGMNKVFASVRGAVTRLMKALGFKQQEQPEQGNIIMHEAPSTAAASIQARRKRLQESDGRLLLNRHDRRFLKMITGEIYPVGSRTTRELYKRVQALKTMQLNKQRKRAIARKFLTTGRV
jgi:hypothetical protein